MGEISKFDYFGKSIIDVINKFDYRNILEIGSWDGSGSTQCIIEALSKIDGEKSLICLELNTKRFSDLQDTVKAYEFVECLNVSSIGKLDFVPKSFDEIWDSPYNGHKSAGYFGKDLVKSWYEDDMKILPDVGFLSSVDLSFDAVLIDGGEFYGYSEFKLLKDRTKCFMLDDVHKAYKCNQAYAELKADINWELLVEDPGTRNGFAIFRRK